MVKESLIVSIDIEAQMSLVFITASVLVVLLGCRLFVEWKNICLVYYKNILLICMIDASWRQKQLFFNTDTC